MKQLPSFSQWLNESNRAVEFFREHPEMLKSQFPELNPHKDGWDGSKQFTSDEERGIGAKAYAKIKSIKGWDATFTVEGRTDEVGKWLTDGSRWNDGSTLRKLVIQAKNIEELKKLCDAEYVRVNYKAKPYEVPEMWSFLEQNWSAVKTIMKAEEDAIEGTRNLAQKRYQKELMKLGLSMKDVEVAMSWVANYTSMSRKQMPATVWPLLQKLTVDSAKLPEYIYRGMFYDGAKIPDQKAFIAKWYPGSKPNEKNRKATSWSADRGTAASFMTNQDFIKDAKGGYYVLLKWKVQPDLVIADFRNLPVDYGYWNQQEFLVSPAMRDYEVDTIIPGEGGYEAHRAFTSSIASGQGAWGRMKKEAAQEFINTPFDSYDPNLRIQWKELAYMTLEEAMEKYKVSSGYVPEYEKRFKPLSYPLFSFIQKVWLNFQDPEVIDANHIKANVVFTLDRADITSTREVVKEIKGRSDYNQFSSNILLSFPVELWIQINGFYDMKITMKVTGGGSFVKNSKESSSSYTEPANAAFHELYDKVGDKPFIDDIKERAQKVMARNIKVQVL